MNLDPFNTDNFITILSLAGANSNSHSRVATGLEYSSEPDNSHNTIQREPQTLNHDLH